MSPSTQGIIVLVTTVLVLLTGAPVAFALGAVGVVFLALFQGIDSLKVAAETLYSGLHDFTLVSIPMFIMMGAAIGSSPAGRDLYEALDRWLYRVPGGLVISNLGACALFAALTGSSPATCAAIGKMGIPEMRKRGYPDEVATGSICAGGTVMPSPWFPTASTAPSPPCSSAMASVSTTMPIASSGAATTAGG